MNFEVGQVWRWYASNDEYCHCMLIQFKFFDAHYQEHVWAVLDLDTEHAGRLTTAYLWEGSKNGGARWERIA